MNTNSTNATEATVIPGDEYSHRVIGLLYEVHNALGPGYQEKYYQRAFEKQLKEANIPHKREQ